MFSRKKEIWFVRGDYPEFELKKTEKGVNIVFCDIMRYPKIMYTFAM